MRRLSCVAAILGGLLLVDTPVSADEFVVDAPIKKVTVYREGASVTRTGTLNLPVGTHSIKITGLPEMIDEEESVRVAFSKPTVRFRKIEFDTLYTPTTKSDRILELEKRHRELQSELDALNSKKEAVYIQQRFLESLANPSAKETKSIGVENWQQALDFLGGKSLSLKEELLKIKPAELDIRDRLSAVQREINNAGNSSPDEGVFTITAENEDSALITFEVTYYMEDAGWELELDSALDTSESTLAITSHARIEQDTGEDWNNVEMSLSTSRPSGGFGDVSQDPQILTLQDISKYSRSDMVANRRYEPAEPEIEEIVVTGSRTVTGSNSKFDRAYSFSNQMTVRAGEEGQRVELDTHNTSAQITLRTLPRVDQRAFVYADTKLENFENLYAPTASLWRDGHYIGSDEWPDLIADTDLQLPYGVDTGIAIEYINQAAKDGDTGFFGSKRVDETRLLIKITNNHPHTATVEVFDLVPVSSHEDLEIETSKGATPPTQKNMEGKQGLLMWQKTLSPGETWEIKHQFRVTYPKDMELQQQ